MTAINAHCAAGSSEFQRGVAAYRSGEYAKAAEEFRNAATAEPASGTLVNVGLVEWRRGRTGPAIQAWEQALWIDPSNEAAANNLEFAREVGQLESPQLAWYEAASIWLPSDVWAWLAAGSLWLAISMITFPYVFRWRRAGWHQGLAALGLGVFLLSIPAQVGIITRSEIGFILERNTPLLLTPTDEGEPVSTLTAGEPARRIRERGNHVFIRTMRDSGWVRRGQLGLICPE